VAASGEGAAQQDEGRPVVDEAVEEDDRGNRGSGRGGEAGQRGRHGRCGPGTAGTGGFDLGGPGKEAAETDVAGTDVAGMRGIGGVGAGTALGEETGGVQQKVAREDRGLQDGRLEEGNEVGEGCVGVERLCGAVGCRCGVVQAGLLSVRR
jgi:hypothetical protein